MKEDFVTRFFGTLFLPRFRAAGQAKVLQQYLTDADELGAEVFELRKQVETVGSHLLLASPSPFLLSWPLNPHPPPPVTA